MLNKINIKHILSGIMVVGTIGFLSIIFSSSGKLERNEIDESVLPQKVQALPIPEVSEFAGKEFPFRRYDVRERLDRELLAFTYMHSTTFLLIKRSNLYFPLIEPILKENGLPDDFKYLALIESYFNPVVVSPAKAAGVWQFIPETAQKYGLEVNDQIDERYNLEKSTVAACKYLKESYELYGDWALAAASYNVGKVRITKEIERQKVNNFFDLYLNQETTRYIYRIIAAKEIMTYPRRYGFFLEKEDFYHTVRTKDVEVNTSVASWVDWAADQKISYAQLKYSNPWIRDDKLDNKSKKTYIVKVPLQKDFDFEKSKVIIHNEDWLE